MNLFLSVPPAKMEVEKHKSSTVRVSVDFFKEVETVSSPAASMTNVANHKYDPKRSTTDFDEELDVTAAASAVRKAIEKAQESIRIAKDSLNRKKKGLQSFSNKTFEDSLNVEGTSSHVSSGFMDSKKLMVVKKVIDEINEKFTESNKNNLKDNKDDKETTKTETSDAAHEDQTYNMFVDDYKGEMKIVGTIIDVLEHKNVEEEQESVERVDVDTLRESKNMDEVVSQGSYDNDSEKVDEVIERKDAENEENVVSDKGGDGVFEWCEDENEYEDDDNAEIHKEEGTSEMFCELESEERVQTCEMNLHDDCEIKHEDNFTVESKGETLDEARDQEFNDKSAGDDKVSEESDLIDGIYAASNIVDMNDNTVEKPQGDDDDVKEASGTFQTEETESMEGADASAKEELCEKISMDQNASDDDEYEVTSEENDARFAKTDVDESDKQQNIIDNMTDLDLENYGNANEIKDKEDETEEPGPSNVSGQYHFRRIYEETAAKERERIKNRLVVEKAISEARERALAEARDRAERQRAAVEKAIEEARQRMIAEAREKVSKASAASKSSSAQSKCRAERAAVERAMSEARQCSIDKAISQNTADFNCLESALRTNTKLEKQNKIMERAAKAIAEKEKRDQLAQKEQAERNRLAEILDAEIKRWSNGKEGDLRALLSTLQYILGPDSGWQPVSLTHIITTSDVKKAYRKATLCVHPDKLQQWGASIQHKYICEKVFDLLKAAWKRFNSEERL